MRCRAAAAVLEMLQGQWPLRFGITLLPQGDAGECLV